jgi:dephospho-CoA kinase
MLKVALTGGIATGKSYVLSRLRERDVPCIEADDVVHDALGAGMPAAQEIARQFGPTFLNPDGSVSRARLGEKVFGNPESRLQLEGIIHPSVYQTIRRWFDGLEHPLGVASIPLLYETGREGDFDFVAATLCSSEQQLERVIRRGLSEDEARQRLAAQMPAQEKARRANFVIHTGGATSATDRQVDDLLIALQNFKK